MSTTQPQLPTMPRDFTQPVECRGAELSAVIAEARAAGYEAHRMTVLPEVVYELRFFRLAGTAEAGEARGTKPAEGWKRPANAAQGTGTGAVEDGKQFRESPRPPPVPRTFGISESPYNPDQTVNLHENDQTNRTNSQ